MLDQRYVINLAKLLLVLTIAMLVFTALNSNVHLSAPQYNKFMRENPFKIAFRHDVRTCEGNLTLRRYEDTFQGGNKLFFLETSGRPHFNPRQACAIESAARNSGLEILVLIRSDFLNLRDNIACQLYKNLKNVHFYKLDPEQDVKERVNFSASEQIVRLGMFIQQIVTDVAKKSDHHIDDK